MFDLMSSGFCFCRVDCCRKTGIVYGENYYAYLSYIHCLMIILHLFNHIHSFSSVIVLKAIKQKNKNKTFFLSIEQTFHKECFKCGTCSKRLDSVNCCEGPDKDIYCKGNFV